MIKIIESVDILIHGNDGLIQQQLVEFGTDATQFISDSKVHGANMGPIWGRQDPDGPMLAPWTLPSGKSDQYQKLLCSWCKTWRSFYNLAINILLDYLHDDVIKWKHYPRYWPFVRGIHRWPVDCPHKASDAELWCFFFISAWTNVEQAIETPVIWDAIALNMTSL